MVYLLDYVGLTQETPGTFFKRGRCRIDAILDFRDKPTFPRRCQILIRGSSRKSFGKKGAPA